VVCRPATALPEAGNTLLNDKEWLAVGALTGMAV
jgi:hypothetical protein